MKRRLICLLTAILIIAMVMTMAGCNRKGQENAPTDPIGTESTPSDSDNNGIQDPIIDEDDEWSENTDIEWIESTVAPTIPEEETMQVPTTLATEAPEENEEPTTPEVEAPEENEEPTTPEVEAPTEEVVPTIPEVETPTGDEEPTIPADETPTEDAAPTTPVEEAPENGEDATTSDEGLLGSDEDWGGDEWSSSSDIVWH